MKYKHTMGEKSAIIDVIETEKNPILIPLNSDKFIKDKNCEHFKLRLIIVEKLLTISKFLPKGFQFKVFETYRSHEKQIQFWIEEIEKLTKIHPDWTEEQLTIKANEGIANPH